MKKQNKFTQIYFNEADPLMEIATCNTRLKHRLTNFARKHPHLCQLTEEEDGCKYFLIDKRRCSLRLTEEYSPERRDKTRALAKAQGVHTRQHKGGREYEKE